MPIIESAKKKMRQDVKKTLHNRSVVKLMKKAIRNAKAKPTPVSIKNATSEIDKAAKKNIIHKNKAARLKSALMRKNSTKTTKPLKSPVKKS